jgi:hypothetical protein
LHHNPFQDPARQLRLLAGLSIFFTRIGDIRGALAVAEQAGVIAQAAKHPAGAVWAECWVGNAHHFLGNQAAAQFHLERGLALAVELGTFNANFFVFDYRSVATVFLARTLWLRGFSDQALRMVQKAVGEAASRDHPFPICLSLVHASTLLLWTGDLLGASDLIEQLIVHAGRYSLEPYRAAGIALKGELAISAMSRKPVSIGYGARWRPCALNSTISWSHASSARWRKACARPGNSRRRFLRSMEPLPARQIVDRNWTCPNCFGLNRRFSWHDTTVNQP